MQNATKKCTARDVFFVNDAGFTMSLLHGLYDHIETGNSLGEVIRPHGIAVETAYDTSHPITVVEIGAECNTEMYLAACIFY